MILGATGVVDDFVMTLIVSIPASNKDPDSKRASESLTRESEKGNVMNKIEMREGRR